MLDRVTEIRERLTAAFEPTELEVYDESADHVGHIGAQSGAGHFAVRIAAEAFEGKSRVQAHRLVYAELADLIPQEIHALRIECLIVPSN